MKKNLKIITALLLSTSMLTFSVYAEPAIAQSAEVSKATAESTMNVNSSEVLIANKTIENLNLINALKVNGIISTEVYDNPSTGYTWIFAVSGDPGVLKYTFLDKPVNTIKTDNKVLNTIYMYLFLQIFTMPVVTYFFNYLPIMGIIYNLLLIPIFTFVLISSFIFLIFNNIFYYTLVIPFKLFDYLLYFLRYIINFTENISFNGIVVPTFSIYEIILIYIFIFFIIYLYNNKLRTIKNIGFITITCFYIITFIVIPYTDTSLYFNLIDSGQGMFSTVKYKNYDFIFDCGSSSNKSLGEYTVVPYLVKKGINDLDGVFISHWDSDHYSGLNELINYGNINIRNIFSSANNEDLKALKTILKKDYYINIDNLFKINILWPEVSFVSNNTNNTSLVVLLNYNDRIILIPGDIETDVEYRIMNDLVKSDILIIPHHGSKTSSSEEFVEAVMPSFSVINYGKNNYGIPSKEVLMRYEKINSTILSTFSDGEINFVLKDDDLYYNTYMGLKSDNYYELYFVWFIPKLVLFGLLMTWIIITKPKKRLNYEL